MSKLLVLDYRAKSHAIAWLNRLFGDGGCEFHRTAEEATTQYDAVLVVDDGDRGGVAALRSALRLRRNTPDLPIAIITPVSGNWSETEAAARGVSAIATQSPGNARLNAAQVRELFAGADHRDIDVRVSDDAILFEYQG